MASPAAPTFESILADLRKGRVAPVYLLHGEEGYFIDELVKALGTVLPEDDRAFNSYVLHAPDTTVHTVMDLCHRIPMMAERQLIILKEAQMLRADELNKLHTYVRQPIESTIFVIVCRGAQAKGKDLMDACRKSGAVVFESKKITDYNAPAFISAYIRRKGLGADTKAVEMLRDFVGTDLSRLYGEIDKLATLLPPNATITPEVVERNIGISREFNSFELVDALSTRDAAKAFRIAAYFASNPKAAPLVMVSAAIFNLFADLLTAYYAADKSDDGLARELNLRNRFAVGRIRTAMRNYSAARTVEILSAIRRYDAMSKGVGSRQQDQKLFYDLIYHILTAPGRI